MNKRIYKYTLEIISDQIVNMPQGAWILSVANQGGKLCLWAMVDTDMDTVPRHIEIIGTGNPVSEEDRWFIGTVVLSQFVWHVFEKHKGESS